MHDPYPLPPIPALSRAVQPIADYLGLTTLPLHIHEVLLTALFYHFVYVFVAPTLSTFLFPRKYPALPYAKRINWNVHVVSMTQSCFINSVALWVMYVDDERRNMDWQERVYGYDGAAAMVQAFAAGYFLWDLLVTLAYPGIFGPGMLAHAVSALTAYALGYRPFLNYYAPTFILWELSSPFLNIHWFFDKLGMTGSWAQLCNGVMLMGTFFSCRLVYGSFQSFRVFQDIWKAFHNNISYIPTTAEVAKNATVPAQYATTLRFVNESSRVSVWLGVTYVMANLTLNSLNCYWFLKMIDAMLRRFGSKEEPVGGMAIKTEESTGSRATGVATQNGSLKPRGRRLSLVNGDGLGGVPPPGI